jgi:hypothetical protein
MYTIMQSKTGLWVEGGDLTPIVTMNRRVGLPLSLWGEGMVRVDLLQQGVFIVVVRERDCG